MDDGYTVRHTVMDKDGFAVGYVDEPVAANRVVFNQPTDPLWRTEVCDICGSITPVVNPCHPPF